MRYLVLLICAAGILAGSANAQQPTYYPQYQMSRNYWPRSAAAGYYRPAYYRPGSTVPGYAAPSNYSPGNYTPQFAGPYFVPNYPTPVYYGYSTGWTGYSPFAYLRDGTYYYP
jgi:hypothetical protein